MVAAAQILPNLWWNASSVMTNWQSRRSSGSLDFTYSVANAPMASPSTSICIPTIFS